MNFTHLHVHTDYSVLDGLSKISDLLAKAQRCSMHSMAITDHGVMGGIKEFFDAVDKMNSKPAGKVKECKKDLEKAATPEQKAEAEKKLAEAEAAAAAYVKFKPICGVEAYCARRSRHSKDKNVKEYDEAWGKDRIVDSSGWHLILLAKNKTGYHNLCKLVSLSFTEGFYMKPRIDKELLERYHEGIIACSACLGGEIPSKILAGKIDEAREAVLWFKSVFGDDYYLELQRHKTDKPNANVDVYEHQKRVNPVLIDLARECGVKFIATNDVHFVEEEHSEAHEKLLWINTQKGGPAASRADDDDVSSIQSSASSNRRSGMAYSKQEWFKSKEEMAAIFADLPEALENTQEIVDKVEFYSLQSDPIMPRFDIPESFATEEEYRRKISPEQLVAEFACDEKGNPFPPDKAEEKVRRMGGIDKLYRIKLEADYLAELAWKGAERRYGDKLGKEQRDRIEFELYIMKTMGFPGYFLIVQDYIRAAREELDVSVGPGRGSAAGSVVAYCLGITDVDPLKYDLLFERFLNPDRISMPDIDVDFEDSGREAVLDYVERKYGKEKVAHIITYGTMAAKSAIADVARVMDVSLADSSRLRGYIPDKFADNIKDKDTGKVPKVNIKNCIKYVPDLNKVRYGDDRTLADTVEFASQLEGTIRNVGVHACGVIIGADDITNFAPLQTVPDTKNKGADVLVTEYDGHYVESVGLIKMDFLGLKTLTVIKEAVANIKKTKGIDLDIDSIPIDDELTYKLYSEGRTVGTFQFESPGMRKYLRELKPTTFEDLIAMNALYRPGPMEYIPQFIARKQGAEPISYDIPIMERYLKDTYGITVYQEQVMLLSRLLADFTRGESDTLRKAMGKKQFDMLAKLKPKFLEGGAKNGHDVNVLEKIWKDWEHFASYAFNKSHATCYSWVAYQTAYLKAHYPSEFMAANLTVSMNDTKDIRILMEECKAMGIKVLLPDVNESFDHFMPNAAGDIRFGLGGIKDMSSTACQAIIADREKNGRFTDLIDFISRVRPSDCNKKSLEALAYSGALDGITGGRRELILEKTGQRGETYGEQLLKYSAQLQVEKSNTYSLFGDLALGAEPPKQPPYQPWPAIYRLENESDFVGMYLSGHPLDAYAPQMKLSTINTSMLGKPSEEEPDYIKENGLVNNVVKIGGMVSSSAIQTSRKSGKRYLKVELNDYAGKYDFILFDKQLTAFERYLNRGSFVMITGVLQERAGLGSEAGSTEYSVRVQNVQDMAELAEGEWSMSLQLPIDSVNYDFINTLAEKKASSGAKPANSVPAALSMSVFDGVNRVNLKLKSKGNFFVDKELLDALDEASAADESGVMRYSLSVSHASAANAIVDRPWPRRG